MGHSTARTRPRKNAADAGIDSHMEDAEAFNTVVQSARRRKTGHSKTAGGHLRAEIGLLLARA